VCRLVPDKWIQYSKSPAYLGRLTALITLIVRYFNAHVRFNVR